MATPYKRNDSKYWWISPTVNGVQVNQSSKTTDYQEALSLMRRLEGKIAEGSIRTPGKMLFPELADLLVKEYRREHRATLSDIERMLRKHILPVIGHLKASAIGSATILEYIERRQEAGAANATINRELAAIKRAFNIGKELGLLTVVPYMPILEEDNARERSYSQAQFMRVYHQSNAVLKDVLTVAYWTGWRKTSILTIEWPQVDFDAGWVLLHLRKTKNKKPTRFPLIPELLEVFQRLRKATDEVELQQATSRIEPIRWVFHRANGQRVKSVRTAFEKARARAGMSEFIIHDFRRTAVRRLAELGYDYKVIMDCCGFKTVAMVIRYMGATPDERIREVGDRLAKLNQKRETERD